MGKVPDAETLLKRASDAMNPHVPQRSKRAIVLFLKHVATPEGVSAFRTFLDQRMTAPTAKESGNRVKHAKHCLIYSGLPLIMKMLEHSARGDHPLLDYFELWDEFLKEKKSK